MTMRDFVFFGLTRWQVHQCANFKKTINAVILSFAALICVAVSAQERRSVAILEPFAAGPVTPLNKNSVRGAINSYLVNTGVYRVVDRARTEQILNEHNFQRSQLSDSSKTKNLGGLLGADLICVTELIKEDGYFNAELSIIDVEIGEVTNAAQKLIEKDDPMSINEAIKEAMAELLRVEYLTLPVSSGYAQVTVPNAGNTAQGKSAGRITFERSISAGCMNTVGLKADGTVVAVGSNSSGQCNTSDWREFVAVSAGGFHTVGLKANGMVIVVGGKSDGLRNTSSWREIIAVSAGGIHTVGLKAEGMVVAVGDNGFDQCNTSDWRDIVAVSAGWEHTMDRTDKLHFLLGSPVFCFWQ